MMAKRKVAYLLPGCCRDTFSFNWPRFPRNISPYYAFKAMVITTLFHIMLLLYFYSWPAQEKPSLKDEIYASSPFIDILGMQAVQSRRITSAQQKKRWTFKLQDPAREPCPLIPPGLTGPIKADTTDYSWPLLERKFLQLDKGGHGKPEDCMAQHRVAIIVPYRAREYQLKVLVNHLHEVLRRQQLDYAIFVVEPIGDQIFNRAKLMNVGYMEAMKVYPWECFVFSDVDLLPEDDRILYSCPGRPRHMVSAIDIYDYKILYPEYFGGVTSLTTDHMRAINGFSNDYWGWGGEDDDLLLRVKFAGYKVSRYPASIARYMMHKHTREEGNKSNECRRSILNSTEARWQTSGLKTLNYKLEKIRTLPLYTHVLVDLFEEEARIDLAQQVKCQGEAKSQS